MIPDLKPSSIRGGECSKMDPEEMDAVFFSGPVEARKPPTPSAQAVWDYAKEICLTCPFMIPCQDGSWGEPHGVWGGTDPYERHQERRRRSAKLRVLPPEERAALAAEMYALQDGPVGLGPPAIARARGLSTEAVYKLVEEHRAVLEERRVVAALEREIATAAISGGWDSTPVWPKADPPGEDGWIWRTGMAVSAFYVGQTPDGAYLRMKFQPKSSPIIKWFPASAVSLRRSVTPWIVQWIGRKPDGVSSQVAAADDQRPGKSAA